MTDPDQFTPRDLAIIRRALHMFGNYAHARATAIAMGEKRQDGREYPENAYDDAWSTGERAFALSHCDTFKAPTE